MEVFLPRLPFYLVLCSHFSPRKLSGRVGAGLVVALQHRSVSHITTNDTGPAGKVPISSSYLLIALLCLLWIWDQGTFPQTHWDVAADTAWPLLLVDEHSWIFLNSWWSQLLWIKNQQNLWLLIRRTLQYLWQLPVSSKWNEVGLATRRSIRYLSEVAKHKAQSWLRSAFTVSMTGQSFQCLVWWWTTTVLKPAEMHLHRAGCPGDWAWDQQHAWLQAAVPHGFPWGDWVCWNVNG